MNLKKCLLLLVINTCLSEKIFLHNYTSFLNGEYSLQSATQNSLGLKEAIKDSKPNDEIILESSEVMYFIPYFNENENYYYSQLTNITFILDGKFILYDNQSAWPMISNSEYANALDIRNSTNIKITGQGCIDGLGFSWWWKFLKGQIPRQRPTMINIKDSTNILIEHVSFLNSPRFNIFADNVFFLEVRFLIIWVNVSKQHELLKFTPSVMFPFNTDGVDVIGQNIHIHDINISNYDDSVAIKPCRTSNSPLNHHIMNCSKNILVENLNIYRGAGLSIGSVSSTKNNCVSDVIFRNIRAIQPLKLIYIKTGGLDSATQPEAFIKNITYLNITARDSILYPIYIGPQQQKEPDGTGDGFWPPTNPYVQIEDITLKNINIDNVDSSPGILRCNISNPCRNIHFINVSIVKKKSQFNKGYICSPKGTIFGTFNNQTTPELDICGLKKI